MTGDLFDGMDVMPVSASSSGPGAGRGSMSSPGFGSPPRGSPPSYTDLATNGLLDLSALDVKRQSSLPSGVDSLSRAQSSNFSFLNADPSMSPVTLTPMPSLNVYQAQRAPSGNVFGLDGMDVGVGQLLGEGGVVAGSGVGGSHKPLAPGEDPFAGISLPESTGDPSIDLATHVPVTQMVTRCLTRTSPEDARRLFRKHALSGVAAHLAYRLTVSQRLRWCPCLSRLLCTACPDGSTRTRSRPRARTDLPRHTCCPS